MPEGRGTQPSSLVDHFTRDVHAFTSQTAGAYLRMRRRVHAERLALTVSPTFLLSEEMVNYLQANGRARAYIGSRR